MQKFALPGLWSHSKLYMQIVLFLESHPEYLKEGVTIGAVYGNFPYCIWDGGRIFTHMTHASLEDIDEIRTFFNAHNIPIRMIFTNPVLEERDLYDRFCNFVCSRCENEMNEIVINSPMLEEYIRTSYPKYSFISSTTKCNNASNSKTEILNDAYKYVCLDYNLNKNKKFLESLSAEEKQRIEFLCNAICPSGCPNRKEHYRLNGLYYLNCGTPYTIRCNIKNDTLHPDTCNYPNNISPEEIDNYYVPQGFEMFKLEGRTLSDTECLLNIARYMIKPEYQLTFIRNISEIALIHYLP